MSGRFLSVQSQREFPSDKSGYGNYVRYDVVTLGSMVS